MPDDSPEVDVLTSRYARKLRQAEGIYQAVWAMWALAYGLCWAVSGINFWSMPPPIVLT